MSLCASLENLIMSGRQKGESKLFRQICAMLRTALHKAASEVNENDSWTCVGGMCGGGGGVREDKRYSWELLQHCSGAGFTLDFVFNLEAEFKVRIFFLLKVILLISHVFQV